MEQWILYWSPEGRPFAKVAANSSKEAVRKAPKPYRAYLGEIYAVNVRHYDGSQIFN